MAASYTSMAPASPAEIQCPGDDTKDEKHQRKLCGPRRKAMGFHVTNIG